MLGIIKTKQDTDYAKAYKNMFQRASIECPSFSLLGYWIFTLVQKYSKTHRPLTTPKVPGTLVFFSFLFFPNEHNRKPILVSQSPWNIFNTSILKNKYLLILLGETKLWTVWHAVIAVPQRIIIWLPTACFSVHQGSLKSTVQISMFLPRRAMKWSISPVILTEQAAC